MYTRSSTLSVKFANTGKCVKYESFIDEYIRVSKIVLDEMWTWEKIPRLVDRKLFSNIETYLGQKPLGCLLKQVSGLIRGTRISARRLKKIASKPEIDKISPEISPDMIDIDWETKTSFDGIFRLINIGKAGQHLKIVIPLKKTKHFNKLFAKGTLKKSCRLSKKGITFVFESNVEERSEGETIGIDVGIADLWSDSRGVRSTSIEHCHKWTMSKIMSRLSSRKKGSKNFRQTQDLRDNFIGWSLNRLNFIGVKELKIEDIKNMRKGKKCDRFRSHWSYPKIFRKIEQRSEELGVRVTKIDPRNTSRRCSSCGAVDIENRKGKLFNCVKCNHTQDADLNAAINISLSELKTQHRGVYSPSSKRSSR